MQKYIDKKVKNRYNKVADLDNVCGNYIAALLYSAQNIIQEVQVQLWIHP